MGIGLKIKSILHDRRMTIKQLSEKSGVSINTLYSITKRDSDNVDAVILQKLSAALDVSQDELSGRLAINLGSDVIVETEDGEYIRASTNTREGKLLSRFQALNELGKDEVIRYTDILLETNKYRKKPLEDSSQEE